MTEEVYIGPPCEYFEDYLPFLRLLTQPLSYVVGLFRGWEVCIDDSLTKNRALGATIHRSLVMPFLLVGAR